MDSLKHSFDQSEDNISSNSLDTSYSIAKVRVVGFDELDDEYKDYIRNDLEEDTHVYLRYNFDCPDKKRALQVWRHKSLLGYVEPNKSEILYAYLRESNIGAVVVSKIKSRDFTLFIELKVYYKDSHGEEYLPYYPFDGRQLAVVEADLWTGQEEWSEDWFMIPFTDEITYKYNSMYDDVNDDDKCMVDAWFLIWCQNYLNGNCITKEKSEDYVRYLNSDNAKDVLRKRITSYLENKDWHFAEKEQLADSDSDNALGITTDKIVKQYTPTYDIRYIGANDENQCRTIKNANINSFIAGIKYRDNYEDKLSKLSEGMEVQLIKEPDNPYDPEAIAVYNGDDHLGYIPKRDIPAIALNMGDGSQTAEVLYVDDGRVDLVVPVTFERILSMSDEELEGFRFYKTERTKYEGAYVEGSSPISKEEFVDGIRAQKENR